MVNHDSPLGHDLLEVAVGHPVAQVEEDRVQDHVVKKVDTFEWYTDCSILIKVAEFTP